MQRLQFPCWEPGQALPTETLLPFLAAVGRCCSRDTEQPGTLLSHCRCRWTGPGERAERARGEGQRTQPPSLCADTFRGPVPRRLGPGWRWLSWASLPGAPAQAPSHPSNLR